MASLTANGRAMNSGPRRPGWPGGGSARPGFTLIELLIVMAIVALLLSLAVPRYFDSLDRAKEAALKTDLRILRDAIDKFHADTGQWPESLQALVEGRYIRSVPIDPVTDTSATWVVVPPSDGASHGVYNLRSGAPGEGRDGTAYRSW